MKKKLGRKILKKIFKKEIILTIISVVFISVGLFVLWITTLEMPNLNTFSDRKIVESTKIYDRTGKILLYDVHQNIKRAIVPGNAISKNIKNAVVATEDADFYQHSGIKPTAILRAIFVNLTSFHFEQGGSTITQQVIKNALLTSDRSVTRKIKEWILALKLEKIMDKDSILALYLNESPFGGNIYGVEEASQSFFSINASNLTIAQSAYLASLLKAPTYYSPYGKNIEKLETRKNFVLKRMLDNNLISQKEYTNALQEKVVFNPLQKKGIKAPHFVAYVIEQLEQKYSRETIERGGLKIITTLDYELQEKAEEIAKKFAMENKKKFNAENDAIMAIDPKTGQILVMVGSRDYFDKEIDGNFNVTTAYRQPGSTFKPIIYATAFKKGYQPETVLFDTETEFSTECNTDGVPMSQDAKCYKPRNFDGLFRGPIILRDALAQSINIPAIKTLYLAGLKDSFRTAKDLGITSLADTGRYGLTLVIGGGEVSLLELTSAYSVFANNGKRNPYQSILKIENNKKETVEEFKIHSTQVLDEDVAEKISDILSDNNARAPIFGANSSLYFPGKEVAVKTGTTNDYKDVWVIGYTPNIAVGAWAGNNNNTSMEKKTASMVVTPMWNAFMNEALKKFPDEKFKKPIPQDLSGLKPALRGIWQGGTTYFIDKISGKLATEYTPQETREEKYIYDVHSILYWIDKNNPMGEKPEHPENDPQFERWEYGIKKWLETQNLPTNSIIPTATDDVHLPKYFPIINLSSPVAETTYNKNQKIIVSFENSNPNNFYKISKTDYFLNGFYLGSVKQAPFIFSFTPNEIDVAQIQTENELRIIVYDTVLNKGEAIVKFNISE